jgi:hypothetical protein
MSVSVYIDGQPAERSESYLDVLGKLGVVPDESQKRFEVWTSQPVGRATSQSVWLAPSTDSERLIWLRGGGAILQSQALSEGTETGCFRIIPESRCAVCGFNTARSVDSCCIPRSRFSTRGCGDPDARLSRCRLAEQSL